MRRSIYIAFITICLTACSKDWVDEKPDQSMVALQSLKDLKGVLENSSLFNSYTPSFGELGADDYFVVDGAYNTLSQGEKNLYSWASATDFYAGENTLYEWEYIYNAIFTTNTVLEELGNIEVDQSNQELYNSIKGTALFFRAYCYFNLAQLYAKPYNKSTASTDLGLIMRLEPDINLSSKRASVEATYTTILNDLKEAIQKLPATVQFKTSPTKSAAFAFLSRVYLAMGDFENAKINADLCLGVKNTLVDYNSIDSTSDSPFGPLYMDEIIFYSWMSFSNLAPVFSPVVSVDTSLFNSYEVGDLRKPNYFTKNTDRIVFKGTYGAAFYYLFTGFATDEIYLTLAESEARLGNYQKAIELLNTLRRKRWHKDIPYQEVSANNSQAALALVLSERRKELCFRGLRWMDLRRLNLESSTAVSLTRKINGQTVVLPAQDNRYVYPIPNNEILHSGVEQNPR